MAPYRPPGRSNRSGRSNTDNDVFEGLPVKQWGQSLARVSLAPPVVEEVANQNDRWGEPPMPRDFQMLQPWTQQLLRLARSGKVGTKRKQDPDSQDDDKAEDEAPEEAKNHFEDRAYIVKKWKTVPEALLEPEHKHFEFLAKRRKGLPSMYGPEAQSGAIIPMRKATVEKAAPSGEVKVYEVMLPEGKTIEGEITESAKLAEAQPVTAAPGTVIEGLGVANDDGVIVAEHLRAPPAPRRSRPPPKKKGGPGRGKKRVTFTNPDGSTYTTIVANATKIVPQPGQTIKHVAKGEQASADVSAEQAAANAPASGEEGEVDEDGSDEDGEDGDEDDDDHEDGELTDEGEAMEGVISTGTTQAAAEITSKPASAGASAPAATQLAGHPSNLPPGLEESRTEIVPADSQRIVEMSDAPPAEISPTKSGQPEEIPVPIQPIDKVNTAAEPAVLTPVADEIPPVARLATGTQPILPVQSEALPTQLETPIQLPVEAMETVQNTKPVVPVTEVQPGIPIETMPPASVEFITPAEPITVVAEATAVVSAPLVDPIAATAVPLVVAEAPALPIDLAAPGDALVGNAKEPLLALPAESVLEQGNAAEPVMPPVQTVSAAEKPTTEIEKPQTSSAESSVAVSKPQEVIQPTAPIENPPTASDDLLGNLAKKLEDQITE
ncbi:Hypothetical protein R9X50_00466100 [Acrodontium crateriforme]|uniref:Zonadhesin n=1 Tax=Acrodontium crateriforme TaxID=150365 RepID=A0AAQ3M6H1_9PEZI|nr:Hypothetical protein R9X50_00466100 [Acrodontium crateriforme]